MPLAHDLPVFRAVRKINFSTNLFHPIDISPLQCYNYREAAPSAIVFEEVCTVEKKTTDIIAYLTWIGLIVAFVAGDKEASKFHLNQSLVIWLAGIVLGFIAIIPILGWIVCLVGEIFLVVCWFIGLIGAIQGTEKPIPLIGGIQLLK